VTRAVTRAVTAVTRAVTPVTPSRVLILRRIFFGCKKMWNDEVWSAESRSQSYDFVLIFSDRQNVEIKSETSKCKHHPSP
jgi:hypothetical protein